MANVKMNGTDWCKRNPPVCIGTMKKHSKKNMDLIKEEDGALTWKCPKCKFEWRERA